MKKQPPPRGSRGYYQETLDHLKDGEVTIKMGKPNSKKPKT